MGHTWPRGVSNLAIDEVSLAFIRFFSNTAFTESATNCSVTDVVMFGAGSGADTATVAAAADAAFDAAIAAATIVSTDGG